MTDHKKWVSEIFDRAAPEYGKKGSAFFNYFGRRLTEQVDLLPNQHVLDVATGRGAVLFPLAESIGPLGRVVGIDISKEMVKETAHEALEKNVYWAEIQCMDAEQLAFPDSSFDFVFCGFALFFLPSIATGLSEFKRVLKPKGKLVISTWGNDSELDDWKNKEIKKLSKAKGLIATPLWSEEELHKVLEEASFKNIQIREETQTFIHPTAEEWWEGLWTHATRAKFEQLSSDQLTSLKEAALRKANSLSRGQGIPETLQVFYGIAQKP